MKINIKLTPRMAIGYGKNATEYYCNPDISVLTEGERKFLQKCIDTATPPTLMNEKLLSDNGELTTEGITEGYKIEREQVINKRNANILEASELLERYKNNEISYYDIGTSACLSKAIDQYDVLSGDEWIEVNKIKKEAKELYEARNAAEKAKKADFLVEFEKQLEAFENGGERPTKFDYSLPNALQIRLSKRDNVLATEKQMLFYKNRTATDREILEKYGTPVQLQRFDGGYMTHEEVIEVLWNHLFNSMYAIRKDTSKTAVKYEENPDDYDWEENYDRLTDEEFLQLEYWKKEHEGREFVVCCETSDLEYRVPFVRVIVTYLGLDISYVLEADYLL